MSREEELNNLSEEVRNQGNHRNGSMMDLIFDPVSGEFRQVPHGAFTGTGDVVTEMTNKGFAAEEADTVVCLRESEISYAEELLDGRPTALAFIAESDENVFHVSLMPEKDNVPGACFAKGNELPDDGAVPAGFDILVLLADDGPRAFRRTAPGEWEEARLMLIPSEENLFSRSKGILEVDILKGKRVMIVGVGSFGSVVAVELAKAGVGSFALFDFDRVEIHNMSRHTATVRDLGRFKINVVEMAILGKNPYAQVDKFPVNINEDLPLLHREVEKADLVICATDNNTSRFNLSKALVEKGKLGIFGRAITRAEGGDVFRYRPGGPCYCCLIGAGNLQEEEISDAASARRDGRIPAYVSPEDADAMVQVGLSSDIEPICNMMVKLALVELSRGRESGISSLEDELVFDYYMWANRRERHYANWRPLPGAGGYPTILRWYGAHIEKDSSCPICSEKLTLSDDGTEVEGLDNIEIDLA